MNLWDLTVDDLTSVKEELGKILGKKHVGMVSTGMAAIETALIALNIRQGDHVLLPSESCYTIAAGIVRVGAVPVFIDTGKACVLNEHMRWDLVNWSPIKAIIAIHEHGLPCDIRKIRQLQPSIPIIEDASLAPGLKQADQTIGEYSDIVVASLGKGKPLDVLGGGVLAVNDERMLDLLDKEASKTRNNDQPPLSYAVSDNLLYFLKARLPIAWAQLDERRKAATVICNYLSHEGFETYKVAAGCEPCWHRIPAWTTASVRRSHLLQSGNSGVKVQASHAIITPDLRMFHGKHVRIKACDQPNSEFLLLIKATTVDAAEKWINGVKGLLYGH